MDITACSSLPMRNFCTFRALSTVERTTAHDGTGTSTSPWEGCLVCFDGKVLALQVVKGGPPTSSDDVFERARKAGAQEGALQVGEAADPRPAFSGLSLLVPGMCPAIPDAHLCIALTCSQAGVLCAKAWGEVLCMVHTCARLKEHCHSLCSWSHNEDPACAGTISGRPFGGVQRPGPHTGGRCAPRRCAPSSRAGP